MSVAVPDLRRSGKAAGMNPAAVLSALNNRNDMAFAMSFLFLIAR